ncbi:MAG: two-component system, chemotaxis family, sensor kinase CheA [Bacillota bacterium]|nr:two-component system, chemotaxis family, sensor kinase CheA [Bacillota bacterium]MDK2855177.1 two-component system, chemotaxis family, sensor kinase CheA [Bacillota bacterium]MDK2925025.1 two-component system, chemotaxis family, sensor kinase CheA [Bacillota bacterium]
MNDSARYREVFFAEAEEHLQELNEGLLTLEKDPAAKDAVNTVFRAAHTIKGMAATMGFQTITTLTHRLEDVLDRVRSGTLSVTPELSDLLFRAVDRLEELLGAAQAGNEPPAASLEDILPELSRWAGMSEAPKLPQTNEASSAATDLSAYEARVIQEAGPQGFQAFFLTVYLAPDCIMKGVRAFLVFKKLEGKGEVLRAEPPVEDLEEEKFGTSFRLLFLTRETPAALEALLNGVSDVTKVEVRPVVLKTPEEARTPDVAPSRRENREEKQRHLSTQTVRIDIHRLDSLMNLVGELVITKTRLEQLLSGSSPEVEETLKALTRVAGGLQDAVMKARMVPLAQVFSRFPRMVRDLARELGRQVEFVIEGEDTELDRSVIDEIGDPLVHLLRNAVDHGIEPPAERERRGKEPTGHVRLSACYEGNHVLIAVEDDGEGIDCQAVLAKAEERGLITAQEAKTMSEKEIYRLLFLPGFSTAARITDVSGRGVGLDVVQNKIESLGGSVEVTSRPGQGTRFAIRLPLTLAIIQALLVKSGTETYALPLENVEEIQVVRTADLKKVRGRDVLLLRGEVVPLVNLRALLGGETAGEGEEEEVPVVVIRSGERAGLVVDGLVGQREIVIKSLGRFLGNVPGIGGATILGDGRVVLILDTGGVLALAEGRMDRRRMAS